jgi:hypothetical protein
LKIIPRMPRVFGLCDLDAWTVEMIESTRPNGASAMNAKTNPITPVTVPVERAIGVGGAVGCPCDDVAIETPYE